MRGRRCRLVAAAAISRSWRKRAARSWASTKRRRAAAAGGSTSELLAPRAGRRVGPPHERAPLARGPRRGDRGPAWRRRRRASARAARRGSRAGRAAPSRCAHRDKPFAFAQARELALGLEAEEPVVEVAREFLAADRKTGGLEIARERADRAGPRQLRLASAGASSSSVRIASARPAARRLGTPPLSATASITARGKSERATRSRWPPRFTAIRILAPVEVARVSIAPKYRGRAPRHRSSSAAMRSARRASDPGGS